MPRRARTAASENTKKVAESPRLAGKAQRTLNVRNFANVAICALPSFIVSTTNYDFDPTHSAAEPITDYGYRIEKDLRGLPADQRLVARQERSKPIIEAFELWLAQSRARISAKSPTGEALKYIAKYWGGLILFLKDGRIELNNNAVERTIRPIALSRKNALFAGHDVGAQNWAIIASLIETCKLNDIEPQGYLTQTLSAIAGGHKQSRIAELLPWCHGDVDEN